MMSDIRTMKTLGELIQSVRDLWAIEPDGLLVDCLEGLEESREAFRLFAAKRQRQRLQAKGMLRVKPKEDD